MTTILDIRPAVRAFLLADPAIAAQVGTRMFPIRMPQGEKRPSIVYNRVSGQGDHHMEGPSGLTPSRVQIDCWAADPNAAVLVANLVKGQLDGYRGLMAWEENTTPYQIDVRGVFFVDEREDYDGDYNLYRMSRDYMIWYAER